MKNKCLACGKPEHEWGPNCKGIVPRSHIKTTTTLNEKINEFLNRFYIEDDFGNIVPVNGVPSLGDKAIKEIIQKAVADERKRIADETLRSIVPSKYNDMNKDTAQQEMLRDFLAIINKEE